MVGKQRKVFVIADDVPELGFIPDFDREGTSTSPYGVLTNKIFKYRGELEGRVLYSQLLDRYGIYDLVTEKEGAGQKGMTHQSPTSSKPNPVQGNLF